MAYRTPHPVSLSEDERLQLQQFVKTGRHSSREIIRATVLLKLDSGTSSTLVADQVGTTYETVNEIRKRFVTDGLQRALYDAPRSGAPSKVTEYLEADVTALACSSPPEGHDHWTVRLLSDKLIQMGYEQGASKSTVQRIQKKAKSNLGKKTPGV